MIFLFVCLFNMADVQFLQQPDIYLEVHEGKASPLVFFAPHENEHLINPTAIDEVQQHGGRLLIMRQAGKRLLELTFKEGNAWLDPNRMFTADGVRSSIMRENPDISATLAEKAIARGVQIGRFALAIMALDSKSIIITLHNNTPGYDNDGKGGVGTVAMGRYQKLAEKGAYFLEDLHIGRHDEDDFFFITDRRDFEHMKRDNWNLVLQNPGVATRRDEDDGSLSVYAAQIGLRYFNIEAQRKNDDGSGEDHVAEQQAMFAYLMNYLR